VLYDTIGPGYAARRMSDPRISAAVARALDDAESIVNVGAGTGSYELSDRFVIAVEPSMSMIRQRSTGSAFAIRAQAEHLPFKDASFSAAMAVLTIHHWTNRTLGLRELDRVSRDRIVILTWDPAGPSFWLTEEYFPSLLAADRARFPPLDEIEGALGHLSVQTVPIPRDCIDGLLGANWCRPKSYLDPDVRSGTSAFASLQGLDEGLHRLSRDIETGEWERQFGQLLHQEALDIGYRLVVVRKR
jgi:SAM-dependent methyltransferase